MSSGSDFAIDVAAGAFRFSMRENGLRRNMRALPEKTVKLVNATMQYYAPQVENYAKNNAPWQDQTGNARNGLAARALGRVLMQVLSFIIKFLTESGWRSRTLENTRSFLRLLTIMDQL